MRYYFLQNEYGGGVISPGAAGKTILAVDDYRSICEFVAAALRVCGYRVLTACGAEEAKKLVGANHKIDLLLTDLEMPRMRGDELAEWFHGVRPKTPILFMSSQNPAAEPVAPGQFLQKPFRTGELVKKVREFLEPTAATSAASSPS